MIITIDGPAGAGKSSVARLLAQRLGYCFLDTGAMYRAITWAAMRRAIAWEDLQAVARLVDQVRLSFAGERVFVDGEDVTESIRSVEVTANTRHVADNPLARQQLVAMQRRLAGATNVVTEGRDQGTVAFPHAECKFFLTASSRRRAERRLSQLRGAGENVPLKQILEQQSRRDREDETRDVGRLMPAPDAIVIDTDALDLPQVVDELWRLVRKRLSATGK